MDSRKLSRRIIMGWNVLVVPLALWLATVGHPWWALLMVLSAHALWLVPTLWPACDWHGRVLTSLPATASSPQEKQVWLTIDDGPDPQDTPELLRLLSAHQAKATFFFIGEKAAQHPDLVVEVLRQGHTVGNHTMRHPQYGFWAYGPGAVRREITECQQILINAGAQPQWFRAPAGLKNPWVHETLDREKLALACWSARGLDGVDADKDRVLARLKAGVRPGAILLMHEGRQDLHGARLAPQVLEGMLTWLSAQGYQCVEAPPRP